MARTATLLVVLVLLGVTFAQKYIPVPGGYAWSECVHHVPDGTHVFDSEQGAYFVYPDGSRKAIEPCSRPKLNKARPKTNNNIASPSVDAEGWQAWAAYNTPDNSTITKFLGNFNVPSIPPKWPSDDGAILYMFTGLQNDNWIPLPNGPNAPPGFDIIQPVLQYGGDSSGGGGKYWAVASWYVTLDDSYVLSPLKKLKPGQTIFGNMTKTNNDTWFIGSLIDSSETTNLVITRPRLYTQPWAYCTLEVYNVEECDWFPTTPLQFTDLALYDIKSDPITPTWQALNSTSAGGNPCNSSVVISSPTTLEIKFST